MQQIDDQTGFTPLAPQTAIEAPAPIHVMTTYIVANQKLVPVIHSDDMWHTKANPFCPDWKCPCHDDPRLTHLAALYIRLGLLTHEEATCYINGEML